MVDQITHPCVTICSNSTNGLSHTTLLISQHVLHITHFTTHNSLCNMLQPVTPFTIFLHNIQCCNMYTTCYSAHNSSHYSAHNSSQLFTLQNNAQLMLQSTHNYSQLLFTTLGITKQCTSNIPNHDEERSACGNKPLHEGSGRESFALVAAGAPPPPAPCP